MSAAALLDALSESEARDALHRCCGSRAWVEGMLGARPFRSEAALLEHAERIWSTLEEGDWREAFAAHPRIGARNLDAAPASTREWSREEQSGMERAPDPVRRALEEGNARYEARFGHVFLICATGRSSEEMLAALESRLGNAPEEELRIAAAEQGKITRLRLEKLGGS